MKRVLIAAALVAMAGALPLAPANAAGCMKGALVGGVAGHYVGHQGLISAHTQGTIEAEITNLGRHLIAVRWDNGLHMYVFPDEIEVDETMEEWNDDTW